MSKKQEILSKLNEEQKIPVLDYRGPQFLVAGPGSGKTFTLVSRTQYMIIDGIKPENILLFTFTNKAAKEIKDRISKAVGEETARKITTGTYHSFCCRLLREYGTNLGYKKGFSIFDSDDSKKLIKKLVKGSDIDPAMLISYMSNQKRKLISPQKAMESAIYNKDELAKYYGDYQISLFNQNAMDFDDLIYNAIKLLKNYSDVLAIINARYKYVNADESHDSSSADIELIRLLAGTDEQNVSFILDDDQSIYGFRGADIKAVLNIKNIFPNIKTYNLNQNYRSTNTIVQASGSLIARNSNKLEKNIFTKNAVGDQIILFEENNTQLEAVRVVKMIQVLIKKYNYKYDDISILYRTSSQSRVMEEVFLKYQIPYEILSGINFFARKEIKDMVAFIKFLCNPNDLSAFTRIVNIPKAGIGPKSIETIIDKCNGSIPTLDALTACKKSLESGDLKGKAKSGITNFIKNIDELNAIKDNVTVPELISEIVKKTNYYKYLKDEDSEDENYDEKVSNLVELIELSYSFLTLEEFLEQTSLNRKEDDIDHSSVKMLTMHMSKGLEWDAVFIIGANEGTNPHFRSLSSVSALEEERRLFYVAMTRARKHLFISRSKRIQQAGFWKDSQRSRFLNEIDDEYMYIPKN